MLFLGGWWFESTKILSVLASSACQIQLELLEPHVFRSADCSGPRIILTYPRGYPHHIGQTVGEVYAFGKGDISWLCSFTSNLAGMSYMVPSEASSMKLSSRVLLSLIVYLFLSFLTFFVFLYWEAACIYFFFFFG